MENYIKHKITLLKERKKTIMVEKYNYERVLLAAQKELINTEIAIEIAEEMKRLDPNSISFNTKEYEALLKLKYDAEKKLEEIENSKPTKVFLELEAIDNLLERLENENHQPMASR
ncbi:hypothetical protein WD019_13810 [Fictibacillus sp. Mic-4]|uniref:hypothetical protein n=1 Tax=Fictibacillus TaxID=1329200 RepID=UPI000405D030|nr:hypothetical protein [Fictibacillus gelatini]